MPVSMKIPGHYIRDSYKHSKLIFEFLKPNLELYDFIYCKGFTGWYLIEQKKLGHIKCCNIGVKFHGYEMFQKLPGLTSTLKSFLLKGPVKKISRQADIVFSYGGKITNLIRALGVEEKKIMEVPSGIEEEFVANEIKVTGDKIRFVFMGRYERRKGIEELTQALKRLILSSNNFEFHFIGPIPDEKKIQHPCIIYHGEIRDRNELLSKLGACDVLVCPSYSEGFPNVILEAMSKGLAVAATPVGAVELLVDEKVGWIIKETKANSILNTLQKIINENKISVDEKKRNALIKIKDSFTWNKIIGLLISKVFPS